VGEGNKKKQIERFIKIEKLDNKVKLLGFRKNISSILKKSDLLVNSSYFEGFPNVVVEALAFQVPTICSKSGGGVFEILKNGKYGDLYNKGDISSLRIKIESHIKNPKRLIKKSYLGYQDLKRFSEKISAKKI
jgi:glycosyltransferase involved in cell wall biosynthesis